jgi:hypothetical protein
MHVWVQHGASGDEDAKAPLVMGIDRGGTHLIAGAKQAS